jgi:glutathione synthase
MRIAFVVAEPRAQRPVWGSAHLATAAHRRGHDVGFVGVDDLTLAADGRVFGAVIRPKRSRTSEEMVANLATTEPRREEILPGTDALFLRYNPGPAAKNPTLDFGVLLRGQVRVINDPEGARRAAGRMYLGELPSDLRPRMLVTRDARRVKVFLASLDGPAVLKPLSGKDGDAVFAVTPGQRKNLNQMIDVVRQRGYIVVQEYLPAQGEKRLILLHGEPVRDGDRVALYRRHGDERRRCDFGPAEERIARRLGPKLREDGLDLASVDIVGDKAVEVNVFTPGGFRANMELYGLDVGDKVIEHLERTCALAPASR